MTDAYQGSRNQLNDDKNKMMTTLDIKTNDLKNVLTNQGADISKNLQNQSY